MIYPHSKKLHLQLPCPFKSTFGVFFLSFGNNGQSRTHSFMSTWLCVYEDIFILCSLKGNKFLHVCLNCSFEAGSPLSIIPFHAKKQPKRGSKILNQLY